jgi:DNA primase
MAGFISPEKLEQIRAASDIVDVIGAAIPLKRAGANFVALCPFHREKSPSFNVNPHRQIFHCFGCHKGGDVFSFVREYEGLSFVDAVKRLAERANLPLEFENQPGQQESRAVKDTLLQMHEQIARRWQTALDNDPAGQIARDYLAKRGVSPEAVQLFRLGFAPEAWDDTVNWSKSKGYDLALAEQAGLIIRKEGTDRFYDRFRGRLMFPICDEQGRIVAFSGRVLSGDEKTAKYVNSPETPIFTKGKVFYGLDKSKRAILDAGFAIICEGQLDLIACFMGGVKNIVAPQGTAFTGDHARILKRYVEEVVLCFDSDNAGQNAAARVLDSLLGAGLAIRVATVPAPHDPDSFIKERSRRLFRFLPEPPLRHERRELRPRPCRHRSRHGRSAAQDPQRDPPRHLCPEDRPSACCRSGGRPRRIQETWTLQARFGAAGKAGRAGTHGRRATAFRTRILATAFSAASRRTDGLGRAASRPRLAPASDHQARHCRAHFSAYKP